MEHRIAPPNYGGEYDDAISYLKRLENTLLVWSMPDTPCFGALEAVTEHDRHRHTVTWKPFGNFRQGNNEKLWEPVTEAIKRLQAEMLRYARYPSDSWQAQIDAVKKARLELVRLNPPANSPIKY